MLNEPSMISLAIAWGMKKKDIIIEKLLFKSTIQAILDFTTDSKIRLFFCEIFTELNTWKSQIFILVI